MGPFRRGHGADLPRLTGASPWLPRPPLRVALTAFGQDKDSFDMTTHRGHAFALALAAGVLPVTAGAQSSVIESGGEASTLAMQGWTVDLGTPEMREGGIYVAAPGEGKTNDYSAPARLTGNWVPFAVLLFERISWGGDYHVNSHGWRGDVVFYNATNSAADTIAQDHSQDWRSCAIPLTDPRWLLSGAASMSEI